MGNTHKGSNAGGSKSTSKFGGKPSIAIKTYTWMRDSHGLFDYESKTITRKALKTSKPGRIVRQGNDVKLSKENDKMIKDEKELLKISVRDGEVYVHTKEKSEDITKKDQPMENLDDDIWLVVKSMKTSSNSKGYHLSEGDLIKLGRVKFRVREFRGSAAKPGKSGAGQTKIEDDISLAESERKSINQKGSMNNLSQQTCRICLSESADPGDPFFSPCHCTGTMKYIHVKCLQRWLKSKLHVKQSATSNSVYWKSLECELCKTAYPTFFVVEDKRYDIVEFDRPECPYIILDILSKDKGITRGIHVIKMENKNNIRLGRAHDSDIRITDISVSRCHAFIKFEKGQFYLDDNNSKFGTLVHLKKAFNVPMDIVDVSLQVGRTVVSLTVKRGRRLFSSCFSGPSNKHNTSHDENDSDSEVEEEPESENNDQDHSPNSLPRTSRHRRHETYANGGSPVSPRNEEELEEEHSEEEGEEGEEGEEEEEEQEQEQEQDANGNQEEQEAQQDVIQAQNEEAPVPVVNVQNDLNDSQPQEHISLEIEAQDISHSNNQEQLNDDNQIGSVALNHVHGNLNLADFEDGPVD